MNDTIPRYKASFPLQTVFVTNADGCGDQVFTQVKRDGNVCLYRRNRQNGTVHGFEVFVAKLVKAGSPLPGGGKVESDYESYPGKSSFGRTAWAVNRLDVAEERFEQAVKTQADKAAPQAIETEGEEPSVTVAKSDTAYVIPTGEFSRVQFAEVNGMPVESQAKSYLAIRSLMDSGVVKESRRVATGGRGRPSVLYVKA